ncbi:MAG: uroporphyrinogen decarboxylase family protein [Christensenella sp.]
MNSYERLMNYLEKNPVDKIPNLCILMGFAAKYANVCYRDFCLVPEKMVEANIKCHEDFGIDIVTVMSDPYGEAMDYGLSVFFPENSNPKAQNTFWTETPSAKDLPLLAVCDTVRMKSRVKTIELYAQRLKYTCPIAGWVEGSVAEYCNLRGINEAMIDFADGADFLDEILDKITEQSIVYIKEQIEAGADIIGVGDAACSLLGPALYKKYALPHEKRLIDAIHEYGALSKLHICGNTQPILSDISTLNSDIVDIDWMVNLRTAADLLGADTFVCGNFDPVSVLLQSSPKEITAAVYECLYEGGKRCIISAGCETPPNTPHENLLAVSKAL